MEFNKKAISPVVATALLLVVAVVAVVGFQTWFTTFQSKSFVDIEQKTDTGASVTISRLSNVGANMSLLIVNGGSTAVTPSSVTATDTAGTTCTFTNAPILANNVTDLTSIGCGLVEGQGAKIVIVTSSGVTEGSQIVK